MSDRTQTSHPTLRDIGVVRALYERFVRGDLDGMLEYLDPEVEWRNPEYAIEPGVRFGHAGFRAAVERLLELFEFESFETEEFVALGDRFMVIVRSRAAGKLSGAPIEQRAAHLVTLRDGKLTCLEWFFERDEALAAAGAGEPVMSGDDIERMRNAYHGISRGDLAGVMELIDPEAIMQDRPEVPDPQTYRGYDGVRQSLARNLETFETLVLKPEYFVQVGDRVVAVLNMHGRGKESGVPVEDRIAHLWTIRDGKAWRMQVYSDPDEAIAAAVSG